MGLGGSQSGKSELGVAPSLPAPPAGFIIEVESLTVSPSLLKFGPSPRQPNGIDFIGNGVGASDASSVRYSTQARSCHAVQCDDIADMLQARDYAGSLHVTDKV